MDDRVLILAPRGRDAFVAGALLRRNAIAAEIVPDLTRLVAALADGVAAVLITEEALAAEDRSALSAWVAAQPSWSDLPFVMLANGGRAPRSAAAAERLDDLGNVVLLERPLHAEAMLGAVRSAIKARQRQYELRAAAATLEAAVAQRTAELEAARDSLEFALEAAGMGSWDLDVATGELADRVHLLRLCELRIGFLAGGDVGDDAGQPFGRTLGIVAHPPLLADPAPAAVGALDRAFEVERAGTGGIRQRRGDLLALQRIDVTEQPLHRPVRLRLGIAEDLVDRKSTRLNSSHCTVSRMPSSA